MIKQTGKDDYHPPGAQPARSSKQTAKSSKQTTTKKSSSRRALDSTSDL